MARPNILIILADGMQAETIEPTHVCRTPNLESLASSGVRFDNAHTSCPTCSPARASFMTGLLPHNHGVLEVEHGRDDDQCVLRTEHPHFSQRLSEGGYRTGYFGKWHVERTQDVSQFGWQQSAVKGAEHLRGLGRGEGGPPNFQLDEKLSGFIDGPAGYRRLLHWGVTDTPPEGRYPGLSAQDAIEFLSEQKNEGAPWCCCLSFSEPNEALVVGREALAHYEPNELPLPANFFDDMSDRPNIYRREQEIGRGLSEEHWRWARACYFGRITELDDIVGRLVSLLEETGQRDNTIIIFVADHGRYVGAHGFDAHNFGAFEEIYRVPLVISGPNVPTESTCQAPVGIADLCPTICELAGVESIASNDSRSLLPLLKEPAASAKEFDCGYAEYHGTRFPLMQRIVWEGRWKFVFNGFDFDELYDLAADPHEMSNLANDPRHQSRVREMMSLIWGRVSATHDRAIEESHYFSMRLACVGPDVTKEATDQG